MNNSSLNSHAQQCLQGLLRIWFDFERDVNRVPIIKRLEQGYFSLGDYQALLMNLRQQVIEGSRWITRSASSFERQYSDVRSIVIGHAKDEHKDYQLLEQDYVAAGGKLETIQNGQRNTGSEALHGFLMYRASKPNPIDLIGAMWIIEGLGQKMAESWAARIEELTEKSGIVSFMRYHGENDETHMNTLYQLLDRVCGSEQNSADIQCTAKVVAKLYLMQLECIDAK